MYHCGRVASQKSEYYRGIYAQMRARGLGHARACRQVADRVLSVFFAMLENRKPYDPALHGSARKRRTGKQIGSQKIACKMVESPPRRRSEVRIGAARRRRQGCRRSEAGLKLRQTPKRTRMP